MLVALKIQFGETPGEGRSRVKIAPTITDNRGNGSALNKLVTTKFPASALAHGTILLHEENEYTDGCRVGAKGGEQGCG